MEALVSCSMSPSAVLVPGRRKQRAVMVFPPKPIAVFRVPKPVIFQSAASEVRSSRPCACRALDEHGEGGRRGEEEGDDEKEVVERALGMDESLPASADELVRRVSSRAYEMRSQLKKTIDSSSYDVLESNPWREYPKSVYVLTQRENQLCTMKTRRSRSEVEQELGLLFSNGGKRKTEIGKRPKQGNTGTKFSMLVEDIREGILVFEDENDAEKYCDLLQGGKGCEGIAEVEASSVFDICHKMRALAVLFRRGRTLPLPETLELNLKARNRSLEDQ